MKRRVNDRPWRGALAGLALALLSGACTTAPMEVRETHYYAVTNGTTTNYFRLRVHADTRLGKSEYRSGWFPADAVESLFGEVRSEDSADALAARREIEALIRAAVQQTTSAWLEEAKDPTADLDRLKALMEARRRVLAYPTSVGEPFPGSWEVEYNPARGVFIQHADEKLVFILSSDPDDVVNGIVQIAEDDRTVYSINQLGKVVAQNRRNDLSEARGVEVVESKTAAVVGQQIGAGLTLLTQPEPARDDVLGFIDALLLSLELVKN